MVGNHQESNKQIEKTKQARCITFDLFWFHSVSLPTKNQWLQFIYSTLSLPHSITDKQKNEQNSTSTERMRVWIVLYFEIVLLSNRVILCIYGLSMFYVIKNERVDVPELVVQFAFFGRIWFSVSSKRNEEATNWTRQKKLCVNCQKWAMSPFGRIKIDRIGHWKVFFRMNWKV